MRTRMHASPKIGGLTAGLYILLPLLRLTPPTEEFPGTISVKSPVDINGWQGTKWRRKIAENFK